MDYKDINASLKELEETRRKLLWVYNRFKIYIFLLSFYNTFSGWLSHRYLTLMVHNVIGLWRLQDVYIYTKTYSSPTVLLRVLEIFFLHYFPSYDAVVSRIIIFTIYSFIKANYVYFT